MKWIWIGVILFLISDIYINTNKLNDLKSSVKKESNSEVYVTTTADNSINIKKIKNIYEYLGSDKVSSITFDNGYIVVEGIHSNLDILDTFRKNDYVKDFYVNKIEQNEGRYVFNFNCKIGDDFENK